MFNLRVRVLDLNLVGASDEETDIAFDIRNIYYNFLQPVGIFI